VFSENLAMMNGIEQTPSPSKGATMNRSSAQGKNLNVRKASTPRKKRALRTPEQLAKHRRESKLYRDARRDEADNLGITVKQLKAQRRENRRKEGRNHPYQSLVGANKGFSAVNTFQSPASPYVPNNGFSAGNTFQSPASPYVPNKGFSAVNTFQSPASPYVPNKGFSAVNTFQSPASPYVPNNGFSAGNTFQYPASPYVPNNGFSAGNTFQYPASSYVAPPPCVPNNGISPGNTFQVPASPSVVPPPTPKSQGSQENFNTPVKTPSKRPLMNKNMTPISEKTVGYLVSHFDASEEQMKSMTDEKVDHYEAMANREETFQLVKQNQSTDAALAKAELTGAETRNAISRRQDANQQILAKFVADQEKNNAEYSAAKKFFNVEF